MKPLANWDKMDENGNFRGLPIGAYIVEFTNIIDNPEKECWEIYCDIAEGEHLKHFTNLMAMNGGKDRSRSFKSYKESAEGHFKAFITCVIKSNPGFVWDWDEKKIIGKKAVAVFGEEEYVGTREDGTKECRTSVKIVDWHSIPALKEGRVEIPPKKLLNDAQRLEIEQSKNKTVEAPLNDDLPF